MRTRTIGGPGRAEVGAWVGVALATLPFLFAVPLAIAGLWRLFARLVPPTARPEDGLRATLIATGGPMGVVTTILSLAALAAIGLGLGALHVRRHARSAGNTRVAVAAIGMGLFALLTIFVWLLAGAAAAG